MSRLKCRCGHTIANTADNLAFAADIIPDQSFYEFSQRVSEMIDSLIEASKQGKRLEWIKSHFTCPPYPTDISESGMIHDLLTSQTYYDLNKTIYQCEKCGRIWIEELDGDRFYSFKPEYEDNWTMVLKKRKRDIG